MVDLRAARLLITNDDGIHAPGFAVLEKLARSLSDDVWVCAPESEQSGASHSLTINRPVRLRKIEERRYTVDGTPTDCVLLAVNHVLHERPPDIVLSGINRGQNIAEDVTYSGTIAAAMEATLLGIRSVALSLRVVDGRLPDWQTPEDWAPDILRKVTAVDWPPGVLININFPACAPDEVAGVSIVPHGNSKIGDNLTERIDPRGQTYFWIGAVRKNGEIPPGTDTHAVLNHRISVTPLHLDLTHHPTIETLRRALS